MKFTRATSDENFPLVRLLSETGRWECGLVPMMFGVRVRVGVAGDMGVVLDYCAGSDATTMARLLGLVVTILEDLPEDITRQKLYDLFPTYKVKPVIRDASCWARLVEMADAAKRSSLKP